MIWSVHSLLFPLDNYENSITKFTNSEIDVHDRVEGAKNGWNTVSGTCFGQEHDLLNKIKLIQCNLVQSCKKYCTIR